MRRCAHRNVRGIRSEHVDRWGLRGRILLHRQRDVADPFCVGLLRRPVYSRAALPCRFRSGFAMPRRFLLRKRFGADHGSLRRRLLLPAGLIRDSAVRRQREHRWAVPCRTLLPPAEHGARCVFARKICARNGQRPGLRLPDVPGWLRLRVLGDALPRRELHCRLLLPERHGQCHVVLPRRVPVP